MNDFDKEFRRAQIMAVIGSVFTVMIACTVLGFLGWVVVQFMRHFGVI